MPLIVVHSDGETWSTIDDCDIMHVTDEEMTDLTENGGYPKSQSEISRQSRIRLSRIMIIDHFKIYED